MTRCDTDPACELLAERGFPATPEMVARLGMASWPVAPVVADNFRATLYALDISFDPAKRAITLEKRGLDFADAGLVFAVAVFTRQDTRFEYGEDRFITAGYLAERCVVLVWTPRGEARRIISMRHANDREEQRWRAAAGL